MFWSRRPQHIDAADLSTYLDEQLPVGRSREVAAHVDACRSCRAELDGLRAARSMLSALPRVTAPRSFTLGAEYARERPPVRRRPSLMLAPALTMSLLVALLAVDHVIQPGDSSSSESRATAGLSKSNQAADSAAAPSATSPAAAAAPARQAGGATESAAPPLAPQPSTTSGFSSAEPTPPPARDASSADTVPADDGGLDWLQVLEAAAALAFAGSLLLVARRVAVRASRGE